ncbi:MAG TPA: nuclear transport factor 2 family protein [Pyrinomonadaceae bacterium]|nr:nuclear transport factor 2 family protein [Pyrinomonadaceae bacterium]
MQTSAIIFLTVLVVGSITTGCGEASPPAPNSGMLVNKPAVNNVNNPLETKTPAPEQTTNNAPTLTPAFKAYCDAMNKKDEAALRKSYSAETIRVFESQMKEDKIKTLSEFLETEVPGKLCEVRNEQITGETAIAEIRADPYPNGLKVIFVKENGEWKLTNKSPGSITQTAPSR